MSPPGIVALLFRGTGPGSITQLLAGCSFTVALFSKGGVLAWGVGDSGELGDGGNAHSRS